MAGLGDTVLFNDSSLVAYYKLENVVDSKSSNTLTNTGTTEFNPARFNNGADFGTTNSTKTLGIGSDFGIDGGAISVSFWVKMNTEIGAGAQYFFMHSANTNMVDTSIRYEYNGGTRRLVFTRNRPGTAFSTNITHNITLGTANFYHLVLTYDTTNLNGYVNNVALGASAASGNGSAATGPLFNLGASTYGLTEAASAVIDDTGVFSKGLSADEVSILYNAPTRDLFNNSFAYFL